MACIEQAENAAIRICASGQRQEVRLHSAQYGLRNMIMNEVTERRRSNEDGAKMEMSSLRKYVTEIEQFQLKPVQRKC